MFVIFKNINSFQWPCSRNQSSTIAFIKGEEESEETGENILLSIVQLLAANRNKNLWIDLQSYLTMNKREQWLAHHHLYEHKQFDNHRRIIMVE